MSRKTGWTIGAMISLALWVLIALAFAGCQITPSGNDPNNPVDPNKPNLVEPIVETGISLAQLLGAVWPPLIPIATAAGGLFAGYKRLKPQLQQAQKESDKYLAAGETLTAVLEDIKIHEPKLWEEIGPRIQKVTSSNAVTVLENTIRQFRGLAPKPELSQGV